MKGNLEHAAQVPVLGFLEFDGLTLYGQVSGNSKCRLLPQTLKL